MSIHSATAQLEAIIEPLIAKFKIEPVGGLSQDNMNFMVANAVANGVMQVAYQAAMEATEGMKNKLISAMED